MQLRYDWRIKKKEADVSLSFVQCLPFPGRENYSRHRCGGSGAAAEPKDAGSIPGRRGCFSDGREKQQ